MEDRLLDVVKEVANRRPTPKAALGQCAIARIQLIEALSNVDFTDVQAIEVGGLLRRKGFHARLDPGHQLLRIGNEFVDVTWMQIDVDATEPWHV